MPTYLPVYCMFNLTTWMLFKIRRSLHWINRVLSKIITRKHSKNCHRSSRKSQMTSLKLQTSINNILNRIRDQTPAEPHFLLRILLNSTVRPENAIFSTCTKNHIIKIV